MRIRYNYHKFKWFELLFYYLYLYINFKACKFSVKKVENVLFR